MDSYKIISSEILHVPESVTQLRGCFDAGHLRSSSFSYIMFSYSLLVSPNHNSDRVSSSLGYTNSSNAHFHVDIRLGSHFYYNGVCSSSIIAVSLIIPSCSH